MYVRAITAEQINAAVTAETVNNHVDLSGVFDSSRSEVVFSGETSQFNISTSEYGIYEIAAGYAGASNPNLVGMFSITSDGVNDHVTHGTIASGSAGRLSASHNTTYDTLGVYTLSEGQDIFIMKVVRVG
ncbi:hypothetical protein SAMN05421686_10727 [Thalassolituus maritimus]|uniref:Uncharacterized protein n=1 Tax=Thalassolituus maritimus TaxID=484498 RepID=A0A1N7NI86_9GAMM|nr:hypothetical protein [Thalassolituus maritimus]SIS97899.1 hypothetical protein SAMN05421686_10727 [Thalassolituus maritimus]